MPLLLEDLAEETSASVRRVADRFAAEARQIGEQRGGPAEQAILRRRSIEAARQATRFAVALLPQVESMWQSALTSLGDLTNENGIRLLKVFRKAFEGMRKMCGIPRELWAEVGSLGGSPDPLDDLDRVQARLAKLEAELGKAIDHRERGWQPADPERYARGVQEARDGKLVTAEELIRRFRPN